MYDAANEIVTSLSPYSLGNTSRILNNINYGAILLRFLSFFRWQDSQSSHIPPSTLPSFPPPNPLPQRGLDPESKPCDHTRLRLDNRSPMEHSLLTLDPLPVQNAGHRVPRVQPRHYLCPDGWESRVNLPWPQRGRGHTYARWCFGHHAAGWIFRELVDRGAVDLLRIQHRGVKDCKSGARGILPLDALVGKEGLVDDIHYSCRGRIVGGLLVHCACGGTAVRGAVHRRHERALQRLGYCEYLLLLPCFCFYWRIPMQ